MLRIGAGDGVMVVEDEIRAKGLGVVLDGSIRDGEDEDILNPADPPSYENLAAKYYHARFEACRWFSMALNAIFIAWIAWAAWRW
jgi:hypothetical protein